MRGGYPHVGGEHDGSGVTPEHEAFPVPESGYPGIEAYACQPLFCRPVSESAALTPEQSTLLFSVPSSRVPSARGTMVWMLLDIRAQFSVWYWRTNLSSTLS
ncbi:hypothetical protein NXX23_28335 [Bacteroides ovatus]|nr:hypothetical protein [Bacteroides ovatus]